MTGARRSAGCLVLAVCALTACSGPPREAAHREGEGAPAGGAAEDQAAPSPAGGEGAVETPAPETGRYVLFFADDTGRLRPERRELPYSGDASEQARRVVESLIEGPREGAVPVLPPGCALRALYLTADGTTYVDFDSTFRLGLDGGSRDALVAVWAVVDTLAVNFSEVRAVKILIEGEEVSDLGGHIDLSRALAPDLSLVAGSPEGGAAGERR